MLSPNENRNASLSSAHPKLFAFFDYICQESSVQGLKYIGSKQCKVIERVFWTIAVLSCIAFSIYLAQNVFVKSMKSPVIISFQPDETPISRIPFPAITICNVNILKQSVLNQLVDEVNDNDKKGDINATAKGLYLLEYLGQYCYSSPSFRRVVNEDMYDATGRKDFFKNLQDLILRFNETITKLYQSFGPELFHKARKLYRDAAHKCRDMMIKCSWSGKEVPCNQTFFPVETRNGHCCTFNMMPKFILQNISLEEMRAQKEEERIPPEAKRDWQKLSHMDLISMNEKDGSRTYPKYQKAGGKPYGLTVLINPELEEYSTCNTNDARGFTMTAHSPVSMPSIHDYGVAISPNTEAFVDIEPLVSTANWKDLKDLPIEKRGCIFYSDDDAKLKHYNFYANENCNSECVANHTYANCSCILHYMPHGHGQMYCGIKQKDCVKSVLTNLTTFTGDYDYCGKCRPACTEFDYKVQVSHFDTRDDFASSSISYTNSDGMISNATNYSILHIYIGTDTIYAKERKRLYNTADLVSNAGGLMSLTLGVSIVSLIEFIYYFTLRAYFYHRFHKDEDGDGAKGHNRNGIRNDGDEDNQNINYYNWALRHYQLKVDVNSYATTNLGRPAAILPRQN